MGLPAMSIQWGPFSDVGLAAAQENRGQRLSHQGFESFTPGEGTALLSRFLERPREEVGLVRLSLRQWLESQPQAAGMRFLTELEGERSQPREAKGGTFRATFDGADLAARAALVEEHVLDQLGRVLRLAASRIDRRAPFTSLGVDSLMSLELRNRLEASLGLRLSAALLFTHTTPTALAEYLRGALGPPMPPPPASEPTRITQDAHDLEQLGADDLLAALDEELALVRKAERVP